MAKLVIQPDIVELIGLKRKDKSFMINPQMQTTLTTADKLFALGTREQINQLIRTISSNGS